MLVLTHVEIKNCIKVDVSSKELPQSVYVKYTEVYISYVTYINIYTVDSFSKISLVTFLR